MVVRQVLRQASTVAQLHRGQRPAAGAQIVTGFTRQRPVRVDVVSQDLCNDVLERLKTTLPVPGTCDLIDINPGRGLWSASLHHALRPRRHVLVEPLFDACSEHLTPLLTQPASKYRHASLLEHVFDPDRGLLSSYAATTEPQQHNHSLLMTVTLSGPPVHLPNYVGSQSRRFFDDIYQSLWNMGPRIYRCGLIRVLAWVPDEDKGAYIPRSVASRLRQAVMLEASHNMTEVAGASTLEWLSKFRRWPDLSLEDFARVELSQAAREPHGSLARRHQVPPPYLLDVEPTPQSIRETAFVSDAEWVARFLELDDRLQVQDPDWYRRVRSGNFTVGVPKDIDDRTEWKILLRRAQNAHRTHMKAMALVEQQRDLEAEWRMRMKASKQNIIRPKTKRAFIAMAEEIDARLRRCARTDRVFAEKTIDDMRAYDVSPRVMSWNRRLLEPLKVNGDEFQPRDRTMALLDISVRPEFLSSIDTHDKMVCFGYVIKTLAPQLGRSVLDGLRSLVYDEGLDQFLAKIPQIYDPTQGGWYDLSRLRLRSLPTSLFIDIALAYESWPFRKSTESILLSTTDQQSLYTLGEWDDEG